MSTSKKAKVVMLPTKEKSDIFIGKTHSVLHYKNNIPDEEFKSYQHLYIISDNEIKEGDWVYENNLNTETNIYQVYKRNNKLGIFRFRNVFVELSKSNCKKIIATTDSSLWRPSHKYASDVILLPQPSQQFIEKFIEEYNRGNVITDVLIEYELISNEEYFGNTVNPDDDVPYFDEKLKINPKDNTITIKKVKDSWNREEVENLIYAAMKDRCYTTVSEWRKWIEENL